MSKERAKYEAQPRPKTTPLIELKRRRRDALRGEPWSGEAEVGIVKDMPPHPTPSNECSKQINASRKASAQELHAE